MGGDCIEPKKPRITPVQLDLWSGNMADLYNALEGEIIRIIIKRLNRGSRDITEWQAQKLSELRLFNNEVTKYLSEVTNVAESQIKRMFEETGVAIVQDIDRSMPYPTQSMPNNLDEVMKAYHDQVWEEIENYVNQTLITTAYGVGTAQLAYQDVLNRTTAMFNTGLYTFEQSLERSITELAQKGINSGMIDRGGNRWSLESYVRMVLKSTLSNTYNELRTSRMSEYGVHTVLVTSHVGARKQCSAIQGHVVDLRRPGEMPDDSEYKSIYDPSWGAEYGTAGGHRGVNCRHLHVPFIPGVNTNNQPHYDAELNRRVAEARDKQRRIEREIVKYKKNLMIAEALKSDKAGYWRMMVSRRQAAIRMHLKENGEYLSRNYKREKVYTPLDTLLKDFDYKKGA
ncbi:phage minor capsid protein [Ornithinibacillus sp. JPR2-1]|uniref:phage minor capsid protein n=1 Tax=Ornithinibacillus sp. JPR2-1 TaxID=2094019 RepID=UPI0031D86D26